MNTRLSEFDIQSKEHSTFMQYLNALSSIIAESIYVIDVVTGQICYISPNDLFLCGYAVEDALVLGNDFYKKVVHSVDLRLWGKMYEAIFMYFKDFKEKLDEVNYFSCTFRLQRNYAFLPHPLPQMVCHKMKPVWVEDELRYLFCTVTSSTIKKSGNLCMYNNYGFTFGYSPTTRRWKQKKAQPFTERERAILMLAQQGKSVKEIANCLFRSHHTIRNQLKPLLSKLNAHSLMEAIANASNNCMMYGPKQMITELAPPQLTVPYKRQRNLFTEDLFQRIQRHLDEGLSIRQAAKQEGIAESAIRYWIGKGNLRGDSLR